MSAPRDAPAELQRLWRAGQAPGLEQFVTAAGPLSPGQLLAVVSIDQEQRWARGERVVVETYLLAWPDLRGDGAIELIAREIALRQRLGDPADPEEYLRRFPAHAARLRQQLELHRVLASDSVVVHEQASADPDRPAPPAASPLPVLPDYEVLGLLGRGAMSAVYRARQRGLDRVVALKMILGGAHANPAALDRFRLEAQTLASLRHPNIVQIYQVGRHDDHLFCVLEYVDGGDLGGMLAGMPQPPRHAAQLALDIARGLDCVHQHGVVHRDLKPANVLLTTDGVPKISDFGLARRLDLPSTHTQNGDVVGTPSYMAPEQAAGDSAMVGPAADVYGLGAILYEMLTGAPPFVGKTWLDALAKIQKAPPVSPSRRQPRVPRDLEAICLKCLEKAPGQRYASAAMLAADLEAFLAGEPIRARPPGRWERTRRWVRRRPATAVAVGAGSAAVVGLLVGLWWYSPLAVGATTMGSLLVGGSWYGARLKTALHELARQRLVAERSVERVNLLLESTRRLMAAPDLDTLLRLISETAARIGGVERATVFLIDHRRGELWSKVALEDSLQTIRMPVTVGVAGAAAVSGETIVIADAYADARFNREVDRATGYRTRTILAIPMKSEDGQVVGVFELLNKRAGVFEPEDVEVLTALAASAASALAARR